MKKFTIILSIVFLIQSCGAKKNDPQANERGRILVESSDCRTCHHATNKIVGPAHLEVAKKYETTEANVKMLADKIIKGGSGAWGDVPMTAHTDLTQADAEAMARYVLSLDGN